MHNLYAIGSIASASVGLPTATVCHLWRMTHQLLYHLLFSSTTVLLWVIGMLPVEHWPFLSGQLAERML